MRLPRIFAAALIAAAAIWLALDARSDEKKAPDGKEIFKQYKCNSCHSIRSQGIEHKEVERTDESTDAKKPPDLSGVGKKHDAAWISKWLLKQETIDGEHHRIRFRGKDSELKTLASWLDTLQAGAAEADSVGKQKSDST